MNSKSLYIYVAVYATMNRLNLNFKITEIYYEI